MDVATWLSVLSIHPISGHCSFGIPKSDIHIVVELMWCCYHTPRHITVGFTSLMRDQKHVQIQEVMNVDTWPWVLSIHPRNGHYTLGMPKSDIQRVVEVVLCHSHTPRDMLWWIFIHYAHIKSLYSSRKQLIWIHELQYSQSTSVIVTVGLVCQTLIFRRWLKFCGAIAILKAHSMVELHLLYTTQSMCSSRKERMWTHDPQHCPSTPVMVTVAWVSYHLVFRLRLKFCGA